MATIRHLYGKPRLVEPPKVDPTYLIKPKPDLTFGERLVIWGRKHGELFTGIIIGFALCLLSLVALVRVLR